MSSVSYRRCSVEGCQATNYEARGFCKTHYDHARNSGQLQNLPSKSFEQRFWEKVDKDGPVHPVLKTPCWIWIAYTNRAGYGQIQRGGRHDGLILAHRASWEIRNGRVPDDLHVLHHCDNPPCVNPEHHFLGTNVDNVLDKIQKGRHKIDAEKILQGEQRPQAKLTESQVRSIRQERLNEGVSLKDLASKYGVSHTTISEIALGKTWRYLK